MRLLFPVKRQLMTLLLVVVGFTWNCYGGAGKTGFDVLALTEGTREASMGGATLATGKGIDGMEANPAALGMLRRHEVSLTTLRHMRESSIQGIRFCRSFYNRGALGVSVHTFDAGSLDTYDVSGSPQGTYSAKDTLVSLGYGIQWARSFSLGARMKQVEEKIGSQAARATALDGGLLWAPPSTGGPLRWSFGTAIKNVGSGGSFEEDKMDLPQSFGIGTACSLFADTFTLEAALHNTRDEGSVLSIGSELWISPKIALRLGHRKAKSASDDLRLGFTIRFKNASIDYALKTNNDGFDDSHRISLSFRFGGHAEKQYQEGLRLMRQERYGEALLTFHSVLQTDPNHSEAVERIREAAELIKDREPAKP
jgi:hypothetical protein